MTARGRHRYPIDWHAAESAYASDDNGAIECRVEAVRLGLRHDHGAGRSRPARHPATGTAQATPDVLFRRPVLRSSPWGRSERRRASCDRGRSAVVRSRRFVCLWPYRQFYGSFPAVWLQPAVWHPHDGTDGCRVRRARRHRTGDLDTRTRAWRRSRLCRANPGHRTTPDRHAPCQGRPDPVAIAANRLFASHGIQRI